MSRLLPPSPAIPGSGCLQLLPAATTARRWTVFHPHPDTSASWRTINRLKRNRGVATRFDKLAVRYEATLHIAAINEWL
ncbi:hypothetical protein GCM10007977_061900 [Dactylosporangium sucinum]|uniref:Transposase DDE domain-containing protein n=1 Tax=Dactylosporangium sucinum TaxID=1424081 RepID=A0A917U389_9ACTN|nr:hypothetical protein GCM10007977_061900 [Dactylosporangium sucinum]